MKIPYRTVSNPEDIDLWNLQPGDICVWDIAHGCARECRFGNQIEEFYSVAEHQIHVASLCPPATRIHAALHDAAEGLGLRDLPGPIKHWDGMFGYAVLEARVQKSIFEEFSVGGFPYTERQVKHADKQMYHIENVVLRGGTYHGHEPLPEVELHCWPWEVARTEYIKALAAFWREAGMTELPDIFDVRSREVLGL